MDDLITANGKKKDAFVMVPINSSIAEFFLTVHFKIVFLIFEVYG